MAISDFQENLKKMFPNYHPEDYTFSIASCCGSCKRGVDKTHYIECQLYGNKTTMKMFSYGYCPQYERNADIKMPVILQWIKNNRYGNGQG